MSASPIFLDLDILVKEDDEWNYITVNTQVGKYVDDVLTVLTEDGLDLFSYYEFNDPWISPRLESWAEKNGGHWEWRDPICIEFYED
jgi:hypothetical protein